MLRCLPTRVSVESRQAHALDISPPRRWRADRSGAFSKATASKSSSTATPSPAASTWLEKQAKSLPPKKALAVSLPVHPGPTWRLTPTCLPTPASGLRLFRQVAAFGEAVCTIRRLLLTNCPAARSTGEGPSHEALSNQPWHLRGREQPLLSRRRTGLGHTPL